MGLSAKRPSSAERTRQRVLNQVMETTPEKKKRLNAEIEESLYRKIKIKAAEEGKTISEITRYLWVGYLSN